MEWAELTCCRAKAVKSGNPMTTPNALTASAGMFEAVGRAWRSNTKKNNPNNAAIVARALVKKMGLKSATATRVAGKDPAKIATPINPFTQPLVACFMA